MNQGQIQGINLQEGSGSVVSELRKKILEAKGLSITHLQIIRARTALKTYHKKKRPGARRLNANMIKVRTSLKASDNQQHLQRLKQ